MRVGGSLAGAGSGAVQRELARLAQSGLVTARAVGNQKHYQANPAAPIYAELCSIVQKTRRCCARRRRTGTTSRC